MDAEQTPVQQQNGQPTPGQEPPGQHLQPFPPLPTSQPATSTNDLLRQAEQVMALIQQRQFAASSSSRRRKPSIGYPDQQRQQPLSGHIAGGQHPSGQSPTISSLPPGRHQPPIHDDLLLQRAKMVVLIVQQRHPCTITAMARNAIQSDAIITHPAIINQQTCTALAPSARTAVRTSVDQLQQRVGESVDDAIIIIDQHNGRQLAPGGPPQLLGYGSSGSSNPLSLPRGTVGCHHAVPVSISNAFSRQQLNHSMEVEWSSHHFASTNAHCWLLHCSRLPAEVSSDPVHHANGSCIEARTCRATVVEPSAHHRSVLCHPKGTDTAARLLPSLTPASTAIQRGAFSWTGSTHGRDRPPIRGRGTGHCYADIGRRATTALSQLVVISHREGGGASGSPCRTLLRASSEVCPANFLPSSDGAAKRESRIQMRDRLDRQASTGHPSWAANSDLPPDYLNEWQLPRPPQDYNGPSPNADVPPSTPGREPASPQQPSASAGSPAPEPPSSSSQSASTSISGSAATLNPAVVQPHRSTWTMRACHEG